MASLVYNRGRYELILGNIDWTIDTIKIALLDNTHTPDPTGDDYFSDVSADEISGTGYTAGGETLANASIALDDVDNQVNFDADDVTGWSTATFTGARYAVVYKDTGNPATSPLICIIDLLLDRDAPFDILFSANGIFNWGEC